MMHTISPWRIKNNASAGQPIGGYGLPSKENSPGYIGLGSLIEGTNPLHIHRVFQRRIASAGISPCVLQETLSLRVIGAVSISPPLLQFPLNKKDRKQLFNYSCTYKKR